MDNKTKDPVCGMEIKTEEAEAKLDYNGKIYYFCEMGCKAKFEKDPEKYTKTSEKDRNQSKKGSCCSKKTCC
ncbi:MAG: YHS domain-containing protein [Proteobacteria bacterium]|nr:YHS domain-containing protein [Pseudomonadota bacterium]